METISYTGIIRAANGDNLDVSGRIKELEFAGENKMIRQ